MNPAFDRAQGNGVDHHPGLESGLDHEQSADLAKHRMRIP
jgi:hypothetical protein